MARRRSPHRIRFLVITISTLVQLPALAFLSRLAAKHSVFSALPYLAALLVTVPGVVLMLRRPVSDAPKPALASATLSFPFFIWWSTSAIYMLLVPLVYLGARLARTDANGPEGIALIVSTLAGLWSARSGPRLIELDVEVEGLPAELDGYRIGQISDVHCGVYTPPERVADWVRTLNAARPDLIAVTGDLITTGDAFVDAVSEALGELDAPDGVFACMGNHDYFCDAERLVSGLRKGGIKVLRNERSVVERDGARLHVAGVEDNWSGRDDLVRTLARARRRRLHAALGA